MSEFQGVPMQEESTSQLIKNIEERVFQVVELENLVRRLQKRADRMRKEIEADFDYLFEVLPGYEQGIFEQALKKNEEEKGFDDIPF